MQHVYVIHHATGDSLGSDFERHARARGGTIINISSTWSMHTIAARVAARSGRRGVGVLFFCCHGNVGTIALGQGLTAGNAWRFRALRGCWVGQYPRIELHSCLVASATPSVCVPAGDVAPAPVAVCGTNAFTGEAVCCTGGSRPPGVAVPGDAILKRLADAAGAAVKAAVNPQLADAGFEWEGPIRFVRPSRYYRMPAPPLRQYRHRGR